ncbi:MAG: hypothetical protein ACW98Y_01155 [Candidatus Thorarchaeota archaeon]|jgi:hypothetical protein
MPIFDTLTITRDLVLVLDAGVIFYALLFVSTLIGQWLRSPLKKWNDVRLAWSVFMAGMAFNTFSFVMSDFYFTGALESLLWVKTGYISMMIALVGFFIAMEQILPFKTRNLFTIAGSIVPVVTVFAPREWLTALALIASLFAFGMLILFFIYYLRTTAGEVRSSIRMIMIGFLIGFVGYLLRSDFVYNAFGEPFYIAGAFMLFVGLLVLGIAVFGSPALDELDWDSQMLELYVIHTSGLLIYHHKFVQAVDMDVHLAAAGIAGIQSLLEEITQSSTGLNNLSIGELNILFAHGENFTGLLIARRAYRVLLAKVDDFVTKFPLVVGRMTYEPPATPITSDEVKELIRVSFEN